MGFSVTVGEWRSPLEDNSPFPAPDRVGDTAICVAVRVCEPGGWGVAGSIMIIPAAKGCVITLTTYIVI